MHIFTCVFLVELSILQNCVAQSSSEKISNSNAMTCDFADRDEALRKIIPESYRKLPQKFQKYHNISVLVEVTFINFFDLNEPHATIKSNLYFKREYHEPRFAEIGCIHQPLSLFLEEMDLVWVPPVGIVAALKYENLLTPVDERALYISYSGNQMELLLILHNESKCSSFWFFIDTQTFNQ